MVASRKREIGGEFRLESSKLAEKDLGEDPTLEKTEIRDRYARSQSSVRKPSTRTENFGRSPGASCNLRLIPLNLLGHSIYANNTDHDWSDPLDKQSTSLVCLQLIPKQQS